MYIKCMYDLKNTRIMENIYSKLFFFFREREKEREIVIAPNV